VKQSHAAVQCNEYLSVPLPVPTTGEVTGNKMEMTGQGGGRVAGEHSHAAVHVCMEKGGGTGVDCKLSFARYVDMFIRFCILFRVVRLQCKRDHKVTASINYLSVCTLHNQS